MADLFSMDLAACLRRRRRLLDRMELNGWDWAVLTSREAVQWVTGVRFPWPFRPIVSVELSGRTSLIAPHKVPEAASADRVAAYSAKWLSTMRSDQFAAALDAWLALCPEHLHGKHFAVEFAEAPIALTSQLPGTQHDLEETIYDLRRYKEADELALIRQAIAGTGAMYQVARNLMREGLDEIELFNALQTAAVATFGEPLTGTGNDYRCAARGGGPRSNRPAEAGELWILDLGPAFRGYFADNARTLAVSQPTEDQLAAWSAIMPVFEYLEQTVKPGKSCRELFEEVSQLLAQAKCGVFDHHLGHGIGLHPHEGPHLNPNWDDTFREGDVFAAEPGLYDAARLRHGIRLENNYRVTASGVELLSPFPMELR